MHPTWSMQLPFAPPPTRHGPPVNPNPAMLHYYEAQMRDHAAAYASAAAAAAATAAQIAADMASSTSAYHSYHNQQQTHNGIPHLSYPNNVIPPMSPMSNIMFPTSPQMFAPPTFMPPITELSYQQQSSVLTPNQRSTSGESSQQYANQSPRSTEGNEKSSRHRHQHHQRRRKRQQRLPSSFSNNRNANPNIDSDPRQRQCDLSASTNGNWTQQGQQKRGRRRRRFWNDAGSSDSGDPSYNHSNSNNDGYYNKNCRRNRKMAKAASSSSDGGSASWITKKKQRQPNDDSLLGKTGVSALYEWAMKRRTTPTFSMSQNNSFNRKKESERTENETQEKTEQKESVDAMQQHLPKDDEGKRRRLELEHDFFETTVSIDGVVMGTGRGPTKTSAKHEASRRALMTLLPGVEFDEESGILVKLPGSDSQGSSQRFVSESSERTQQKTAAITSLEELAPNLAKQLAIGHSNDDDDFEHRKGKGTNICKLPGRDSRKRQKWPHVYSGTSTTSDDEDEDSYYASRGAYVCSSLLHAMVQIDERLTEPPEFKYQVSAVTNEPAGQHSKLKRKACVPIKATSTAIPRGFFQCTGTLKLRTNFKSDSTRPEDADGGSSDGSLRPRECYRLLRSSGVGGTKRDARYTAAAKLLALLFPECDGMAQVKQAAEAARQNYAETRALKQQSKRAAPLAAASRTKGCLPAIRSNENIGPNLLFTALCKNAPKVPDQIHQGFTAVLGNLGLKGACTHNHSSVCENEFHNVDTSKETGLLRQLSRQHQLEESIDSALQKLNEHDEEGRSLPEELTADDVGRTVLRRANVDDIHWLETLFKTKPSQKYNTDMGPLFGTILESEKGPSSLSMKRWSSSTIVLLLCRAIAPHEDPPLGCAVLTLGFSMQRGKILRIAQIASKSHQPRERFIETLSKFAANMGCALISSPSKTSFANLEKDHLQRMMGRQTCTLNEYRKRQEGLDCPETIHDNIKMHITSEEKHNRPKPSLQSVQEEVEGIEESDSSSPKDKKTKRREKPSKRSRFQ
ncbi:unnamed protein product [Pseudo-nitzschia multistriata]|uniref:DRBM domain-containing protein n=1 Tax=Pseudo-nitzschia multistriata TaxID=183589 RepID=A0A448Z332_9STRA|nr:unnamed protein product [Pseudo-nitzschia multistriata]